MEQNQKIQDFLSEHEHLVYSQFPLHRYLFNVEKQKFRNFVSNVKKVPEDEVIAVFVAYSKDPTLDCQYYQKYPDDIHSDLVKYFEYFLRTFPPPPKSDSYCVIV
jgi:hypothetical protein